MANRKKSQHFLVPRDGQDDLTVEERLGRLPIKRAGYPLYAPKPTAESSDRNEKRELPLFLRGDETDETIRQGRARLFPFPKDLRNKPYLFEESFEVDRSIPTLETINLIHSVGGRKEVDPEFERPGSPFLCKTGSEKEVVRMGFFWLSRFESIYDLRNWMTYYSMVPDTQALTQRNLAEGYAFTKKYLVNSTVVQNHGWVYLVLLWYNGKPETYLVRDFSRFEGGRGGLRYMDQTLIGGVITKKR